MLWPAVLTVYACRASPYCKTLFFRRILISLFPYVENSLHFNFVDFPVDFIKQFVSCFFWCLKQMLFSKFIRYYCYITKLHYIIPRILHIISRKSWYSMQINCSSKNLRVFNSRFYSYRENLMLAKYTCFTVISQIEKWTIYKNL